MGGKEEKLIINTTYKCNNHCIFCSIADRSIEHGDFETQLRHLDKARESGIELLDIDGGEPTLYPRLFDLIEAAREKGFTRITITSNGRMLSDPGLVDRLTEYPIQLLISLHAADPEDHEYLTTQPGSFRQTLRGIINSLKRFPDLGVNTTVVASNTDSLEKMGRLLVKLGVKTWNIQFYTPFGLVKPELAPDPYAAGKMIGRAIDLFHDRLDIQVVNLPFCFLPGHEKWALEDYKKSVRRMLFVSGEEVNLADYLAEKRFKNGRCDDCPYDAICRGFWDYGCSESTGRSWRIRMLDVLPGYTCSARCIFCAVEEKLLTLEMPTQAVIDSISQAMIYGPSVIRFGGGEPTEREDLEELVRFSSSMRVDTVALQTHGFKLADPEYLEKLVNAGVTKFNISIRGADKETHERLTLAPGSFEILTEAVRAAASLQPRVDLELDGILTKQTVGSLAEQIQYFHNLGANKFNYWFISAEGRASERPDELVPNMTETAEALKQAAKEADALGIDHFRVFYIPYCFFKGKEKMVWHPLEENALVITPNSTFTLDQGTLDLGVKVKSCEHCAIRDKCFGIAPSYVRAFGEGELQPYDETPDCLSDIS